MQKQESSGFDFGSFIDSNRVLIGSFLLICVAILGVILIWKENYFKTDQEKRIENLEAKIWEIETKEKGLTNNSKVPVESEKDTSIADVSKVENAVKTVPASQTASQDKLKSQVVVNRTGKINLNTATLSELDTLSGIGPTYAKRIIEYRNSKGGFKSILEIKNVKGIGDATFNKFKDKIEI